MRRKQPTNRPIEHMVREHARSRLTTVSQRPQSCASFAPAPHRQSTSVDHSKMALLLVAAVVSVLALAWLYRINSAMRAVPDEATRMAPRRWTREEIRETYERMKKTPTDFAEHLPPCLDRRYLVVGGCGMVGGDIVLQLCE